MTDSEKTSGTPDERGTERSAPSAVHLLRAAREQFAELTGLRPEGLARFERTQDGGWVLEAEVVELSRIPDTMSVMALYEVTLDSDGMLTGYRRLRRYERGRTDSR
ncbi:gas vesicle protein GvpO [Streptomyces sp. NPDC049555]|uniref:gas vesicle protein GvpO n=1 Tax=unclassified Streptomyces TaxID=2593676 RepID=UPI0034439AD8